jgi:hypothetical protein
MTNMFVNETPRSSLGLNYTGPATALPFLPLALGSRDLSAASNRAGGYYFMRAKHIISDFEGFFRGGQDF